MKDYRNEVLAELKKEVSQGIKLPDARQVSFQDYKIDRTITISMKSTAVTENMQADVAAFEAWAVALHHWLGGLDVLLKWEKPTDAQMCEDAATKGHYMRFLFRAQNFSKWFSWFNVLPGANQKEVEAWNLEKTAPLFLNTKSYTRDCCCDKPNDDATENEIECYLASPDGQEKMSKALGWQRDYMLERQIPVGLFKSDPPTRSNALFSHGKSAMDLCAVDGNVANVIELKSFKAKPKMGALSEALLYSEIIRGVQKGQICFTKKNPNVESNFETRLLKTRSVKAYILAPCLHPLLDCDGIFKILNRGPKNNNISVGYLELGSGCSINLKYNANY